MSSHIHDCISVRDPLHDDPSTARFWDGKAHPFSHYERRTAYADRFLELSGIRPDETVFDMGCGSGTLCIPLADDGHEVFCADFSSKMLESVQDVVEEEGLKGLTLRQMSWQDDWENLDLPICDLAFASRSLFEVDAADAIRKLDSRARRRVCITIHIPDVIFDDETEAKRAASVHEKMSFFEETFCAICELGRYPQLEYLNDWRDGKSVWAFIAWDKL